MKSKKTATQVNSQIDNSFDASQFEVVHSGSFSPMWKPDTKNEYVIIAPDSIRKITVTQKKKSQDTYLLEGKYQGGNTKNFFGNKTAVDVMKGDTISIPISSGLIGKNALGVHEKENDDTSDIIPSPLIEAATELNEVIMVKFVDRINLKGGQTFKSYQVLANSKVKNLAREK